MYLYKAVVFVMLSCMASSSNGVVNASDNSYDEEGMIVTNNNEMDEVNDKDIDNYERRLNYGKNHYDGTYYADLGRYGEFWLYVSDTGTMSYISDLKNIDDLVGWKGVEGPINNLNYHLHTKWNRNALMGVGGKACGPDVGGGHHDPYFACSPTTAVPADMCAAIGRPRDPSIYACTPKSFTKQKRYDECEVGDLSNKYGQLKIRKNGKSYEEVWDDPLPAINANYQPKKTKADNPSKFASIIFHNGAPRVLCGKLVKIDH